VGYLSPMSRRPIEILHLAFAHYPADPRVKREAEALRALDRRVAVVVLRSEGQRAVERCNGVLAIRVPGRKTRAGFLATLRDYVAFMWRCRALVSRHRRLSRVRVVQVHTLPDFLLWAALPARRRGARLVFDMHEIFPEFALSKFPGLAGRVLERVARAIERWARRGADLTITVNRPIDELLSQRPIDRPTQERRLVLHNTADPADFGNGLLTPQQQEPEDRDRPLELVYHGTLTRLYGLDLAVLGALEARQRGIPVRLTVIGNGPDREALGRLAARHGGADVVRFEAPLPQAALPARLGSCDAGVVPTRLDAMTRYSLSNKLLEYVHLGIPIIAARLPSYAGYLAEDAAWYWTPGDPGDLARAILAFAASSAGERAHRVEQARQGVAPFAWSRERERLLSAYRGLLRAD
jgi:glycosyltransferase involved in cell wall biosynthesis